MFCGKSLWLLALATTLAGAADVRFTNAKMNCFIKHLEQTRLLRDNFEQFPTQSTFDASSCEKYVADVQKFYYQRAKNGSSFSVIDVPDFQEILNDQGDCIERNLRTENYGDLILKSLVYDALQPLTADLANERNDTVTKLQSALSKAISACTFTALYDKYIDIRRHNYCARKFVVENDIMGLRHFNLTLNPFRIDLSAVNCNKIIGDLVEKVAEEDNGIGEADALQILSHEWGVIFLTEINVSKEQRDAERSKYEKDLQGIVV